MEQYPKILRVETGFVSPQEGEGGLLANVLDYRVYEDVPGWWRRVEELLRLDIYLALSAKRVERQYDAIWARSEKVGIPLSFLQLRKPLVVTAHYMESPAKAKFARVTGIARGWAGIGYISRKSRDFFIKDLRVPPDRLFQCESAKYLDRAALSETTTDGPIMSVGVAKRDYNTLISALAELPGHRAELFISSRFGDSLRSKIGCTLPKWVRIMDFVPEDELLRHYRHTRFVIVPLSKTRHNSAGISAVLEAGAFGKAVIATRTGGMEKLIRHGETGLLVPPGDVVALQDAIHKLWRQPELAEQMGLAGRRYVEAEFHPKRVNSGISACLINVCSDSQRRG